MQLTSNNDHKNYNDPYSCLQSHTLHPLHHHTPTIEPRTKVNHIHTHTKHKQVLVHECMYASFYCTNKSQSKCDIRPPTLELLVVHPERKHSISTLDILHLNPGPTWEQKDIDILTFYQLFCLAVEPVYKVAICSVHC